MKANIIIIIMLSFVLIAKAQVDFNQPQYYSIGTDIGSLTIGDVNNDGLNDAVVATEFYFDPENDYHIFVFIQNQSGTFDSPDKYSFVDISGNNAIVKIADLNDDNLNDIAVGSGEHLGVLFQNNYGTFDPIATWYSGAGIDAIQTGDLNNDGLQDIVVSHWNEDYIKVFYQNPVDTFSSVSYAVESGGRDEVDVADVNSDGLDDIIFMPGQNSVGTLVIFYQDAISGINPTYTTLDYEINNSNRFNGIAIDDLNNDGRNDIVGSIGGNNAWIAIIYQNSSESFDDAIFIDSYDIPTPVEIADLNCDGYKEIVVGNRAWSHFSVFEQDSFGNYNNYVLFENLNYVNPYGLALGDLNNDSRIDVLTTDGQNNVNFIYNTSAPDILDSSDTIINIYSNVVDTLYSYNPYITNISSIDTINECIIETINQCEIVESYVNETIIGDSIIVRYFEMCGNYIIDSLIKEIDINEYYTSYDSTCNILSVDTLFNYYDYIDSYSIYDTLDIYTEIVVDDLVLEEVNVSNDTAYIITDSLSVETRYLVTYYIAHNYTIFEGVKCGNLIIDTVNSGSFEIRDYIILGSDTTLISHTEEVFYLEIGSTPDYLQNINIYPNPTTDIIYIEAKNISLVEVIDVQGQIILSQKQELYDKKCRIDLTNCKNGIYIISITIDNQKYIKKVVKN